MLDDLTGRGPARPDLVIVEAERPRGGARQPLGRRPVQPCTVHKERNLLGRANTSARRDQGRVQRDDARRDGRRGPGQEQRSWRAGSGAVARSPTAWRSRRAPVHLPAVPARAMALARTTNAIERLHEEFKRRIRPVPVPVPTAAMLFWALRPRVRSPCAGSMAGQPSTVHPSTLTSPLDRPHALGAAPPNFHQLRHTTRVTGSEEGQKAIAHLGWAAG